MFNNKTPLVGMGKHLRVTPFAMGFTHAFGGWLNCNPFDAVTEGDWFANYEDGFTYGRNKLADKRNATAAAFMSEARFTA